MNLLLVGTACTSTLISYFCFVMRSLRSRSIFSSTVSVLTHEQDFLVTMQSVITRASCSVMPILIRSAIICCSLSIDGLSQRRFKTHLTVLWLILVLRQHTGTKFMVPRERNIVPGGVVGAPQEIFVML